MRSGIPFQSILVPLCLAALTSCAVARAATRPVRSACPAKMRSQTAAVGAPPVVWLSSFSAAQDLARKTGKPILIDFGAVWCNPCHALELFTLTSPVFRQEAQRWICVHVDTDKSANFSAQMGVTGMPAVAMYRGDGSRVGYFVGFEPPADCVAAMRRVYPLATSKAQLHVATGPMVMN